MSSAYKLAWLAASYGTVIFFYQIDEGLPFLPERTTKQFSAHDTAAVLLTVVTDCQGLARELI